MQVQNGTLQVEKWNGLTPYEEAMARMEDAVANVIAGGPERLIFCQHEPVYTVGTSGNPDIEVLAAGKIPVLSSGRGGKTTFHGPGQVVLYPILNLATRGKDLRAYIQTLQNLIISLLAEYGIEGKTTDDIGVWVETPEGTAKIAAIGVRVRKWVAFHGIALNVNPDLTAYNGIIPCGLAGKPVTSLKKLGVPTSLGQVEIDMERLCQQFLRPTP